MNLQPPHVKPMSTPVGDKIGSRVSLVSVANSLEKRDLSLDCSGKS